MMYYKKQIKIQQVIETTCHPKENKWHLKMLLDKINRLRIILLPRLRRLQPVIEKSIRRLYKNILNLYEFFMKGYKPVTRCYFCCLFSEL